jgi:hypothetical protein
MQTTDSSQKTGYSAGDGVKARNKQKGRRRMMKMRPVGKSSSRQGRTS